MIHGNRHSRWIIYSHHHDASRTVRMQSLLDFARSAPNRSSDQCLRMSCQLPDMTKLVTATIEAGITSSSKRYSDFKHKIKYPQQ